MRDSLLHDSGLGAAATISDGMAGRAAPGGRRARRACTGICLHACLLRAAARGGLPGMHWDLPACLPACMVTLRFFGWLCPGLRRLRDPIEIRDQIMQPAASIARNQQPRSSMQHMHARKT